MAHGGFLYQPGIHQEPRDPWRYTRFYHWYEQWLHQVASNSDVLVSEYRKCNNEIPALVKEIEQFWSGFQTLLAYKNSHIPKIESELEFENKDAQLR